MPDTTLTPGAVATTDRAEICAWVGGRSYSQRHRMWESKRSTLLKYGLDPRDGRHYEDDDLVPVCLGGDNANPLNHWPMPWPEAREKDELEGQTCRAVCAGRMTPEAGQAIFTSGRWREMIR